MTGADRAAMAAAAAMMAAYGCTADGSARTRAACWPTGCTMGTGRGGAMAGRLPAAHPLAALDPMALATLATLAADPATAAARAATAWRVRTLAPGRWGRADGWHHGGWHRGQRARRTMLARLPGARALATAAALDRLAAAATIRAMAAG